MTRRRVLPLLILALTAGNLASTRADSLACLRPVSGVTWLRWEQEQQTLDLWCQSVGPPVFTTAPNRTGEISRLMVLSWNVHVGGADVEKLIAETLGLLSEDGTGLVLLLQETFRAGVDVPESYPHDLRVPSSIRPRRPALDIVAIASIPACSRGVTVAIAVSSLTATVAVSPISSPLNPANTSTPSAGGP